MELTGIDTLRYTNPYPEPLPEEGTYKVYNNPGNTDIKTLLKAPSRPVFIFPKNIWDEVQYLTKQSPNSEFALFLITKQFTQLAPKYMAIDLFFPKQEAGSGGVSIDNDDCLEFYDLLNTHEEYKEHMHSHIAHLHSHNQMGVFWSGADSNQQLSRDDLGFFDDFRFYLVVNTKDQVRCSFVVYKPVLRRIDDVPVVVIGTEDTLTDERKAELDAYLEERVSKLTTNVFQDIKIFDGYETELPPPPVPVYTPPSKATQPGRLWDKYFDDEKDVDESVNPWLERARAAEWTSDDDYDWSYFDYELYNKAVNKVMNYAKHTYTGTEYASDELADLSDELMRFDVHGFLMEAVLDDDMALTMLAEAFNGDMTRAVDAYEWLVENWTALDTYRDLINDKEVY